MVKSLPAMQEPWVRKIPRRREWQPTPGFFPGESHGQRTLVGYSPWGHKQLDMAGPLTLSPEPMVVTVTPAAFYFLSF